MARENGYEIERQVPLVEEKSDSRNEYTAGSFSG